MVDHGFRHMPVEPVVAAHLHPKTSLSSAGQPLPSKMDRFQSSLLINRKRLLCCQSELSMPLPFLMAYQAELEEEVTGVPDPAQWEEVCIITDHCLHLHKVAIQALGRAMGLMVMQERARWLNLTTLLAKEKEDLLDTPITPQGLFGVAVLSMQKRCEEKKRDDEALKLCLPRKPQSAAPTAQCQTFAQADTFPSCL
ncbi:hypothetical protein LDENG_00223760 [Lucifuga dentata]|nr:hypothetical protein LDENG_00223760 [Lucifuga dentata]